MSEREGLTAGRCVTRGVSLPPIHVDCSNWVDTSDGTWTSGTFEVRRRVLPPVHVDCSGWGRDAGPGGLELAFADTAAGPLVEVVNRALQAATAADPELGLAYDSARSHGGTAVRVVLSPRHPSADPGRLEAVVAAVRAAVVDPTVAVRAVAA